MDTRRQARGLAYRSEVWCWLRKYGDHSFMNHEPAGWTGGGPTFSMMDGGRLYVPVDGSEKGDPPPLRAFYGMYARAIRNDMWFALSENATRPVARLFFDVDAEVVSDSTTSPFCALFEVGGHIARAVGECVAAGGQIEGSVGVGNAIVLMPFMKHCVVFRELGPGVRKLSMHIIVPDLAVEAHVANAVRHVVAARLDKLSIDQKLRFRLATAADGSAKSWLSALDPASALRVPYSVKVERCTCNPKNVNVAAARKRKCGDGGDGGNNDMEKRQEAIKECMRTRNVCSDGWVILHGGCVFKPIAVHDCKTGDLLRAQVDTLNHPFYVEQMLLATSIRVRPGTLPSPHVTWDSCLAALARITGTSALPTTLSESTARGARNGQGAEWAAIPLTDAAAGCLLRLVRAHHSLFCKVDLAAISMASSGHAYRVDVCGPGGDRCLNLISPAATHKCGAVPYFVVSSREGVSQRCSCWSNCGDHRRSGKACKSFKSSPTPVPADDQAALYPLATTTTARFVPRAQPATAWRRKVPPL